MLQYAAQGAAQALEDAAALVNAYKKHGPSKMDAVFQEYEGERIPHTSKVVQFARMIGVFAHHDGANKVARDTFLRQHDMNDHEFLQWMYAEKQTRNN